MTRPSTSSFRSPRLRAIAGGLFVAISTACAGEGIGPSEATNSADSPTTASGDSTQIDSTRIDSTQVDSTALAPTDSTALPPTDTTGISDASAALDTRSRLPGIVFASDNIPVEYFNSVHNGSKYGGAISPSNVLEVLAAARAKGGRLFLKLHMGRDSYVQDSNGTFSLTKWKSLIDRFKGINLAPYIADGTIVAHFLIDEPHRAAKWGGKIIPQATVEAMAQYSKQIWPTLTTVTHTQTPWLASSSITYRYLDASWSQYAAAKGEIAKWTASEIASAKSKRLGIVLGLNVLDGGNGSSKIPGWSRRQWAMSANEMRTYGAAVLNQSYACAFFMWAHDTNYYGRTDIELAMAELSAKAKAHAKTSCQQ